MSPEIVRRNTQTLIGFEIRTSNDRAHELGEHWGRFLVGGIADEIPQRVDETILAVHCEYEGDQLAPYTFFLGCPVAPGTDVPPGMVERSLPAGRYARFVARGPQPDTLIETWQAIWKLPHPREFGVDYEIHHPSDPDLVEVFVGYGPGSDQSPPEGDPR